MWWAWQQPPAAQPLPSPTATATPEPLAPTRTPTPAATETPTPTLLPSSPTSTRLPQPSATPTLAPSATPTPLPSATPVAPEADRYAERFGVAGPIGRVAGAQAAGLPFSVYLDWHTNAAPVEPAGIVYWQMVRLHTEGLVESWDTLAATVAARPGNIWVVGNEPDVIWQDNLTAPRYAELYHDVYTFIKERDPSALLAVAGVSQSTPLRRAYLDLVLDSYVARYGETMPVDIWTVHAFTLREEAGSWGVDIPPGLNATQGILYEIDDHDNLDHFQQNLIDFRIWMAERGYQDRPLAVTEFGILLPNDYGFPPQSVAAYLTATFDFLLTARHESGYPADGNRLVQWWFWYSLEDDPDYYPTGDLYDSATGALTLLGQAYRDFYFSRQINP